MTVYNKRKTGSHYEEEAAEYLAASGYRIIFRNFRCRSGEIDLVAYDGDVLVFIEVKYRSDNRSGHPLEAVDRHKQVRICRVADFYRVRYQVPEETPCRFDVAAITGNDITVLKNAFPYCL